MDLKEIGCEDVDWIFIWLRMGQVVGSCEHCNNLRFHKRQGILLAEQLSVSQEGLCSVELVINGRFV